MGSPEEISEDYCNIIAGYNLPNCQYIQNSLLGSNTRTLSGRVLRYFPSPNRQYDSHS